MARSSSDTQLFLFWLWTRREGIGDAIRISGSHQPGKRGRCWWNNGV
jgi:hypothetical protein